VESGLTLASESFVGVQKKWCYKNFDIPTSNTNICSAPAENRVCVRVHEQTIISAQEVAKLFKVGHSLSCATPLQQLFPIILRPGLYYYYKAICVQSRARAAAPLAEICISTHANSSFLLF
jgi:hypothetical protein